MSRRAPDARNPEPCSSETYDVVSLIWPLMGPNRWPRRDDVGSDRAARFIWRRVRGLRGHWGQLTPTIGGDLDEGHRPVRSAVTPTNPPSAPPSWLSHYRLSLPDGHRVGVSIGGDGVPLVFLHGIALNKSVYLRFLSRLSELNFRVIAIDAAAHGHTAPLPEGPFGTRVDLTLRTLDALGVRQAVFVGHSMGGRMTIELAARAPHRVLAAVLLDAAAGDQFDARAAKSLASPDVLVMGLLGGLYDTASDWRRCGWRDRRRYGVSLARAIARWTLRPQQLAAAMRAVAGASSSADMLHTADDHGVTTIVVHGEDDLVVPWANAESMAAHGHAALYKVPNACHSWMIADPARGAQIFAGLMRAELGQALQRARAKFELRHGHAGGWESELLVAGGLAATLGSSPPGERAG